MTIAKKRINVTVSSEMNVWLTKLAKRDRVSKPAKIQHLLRLALEIEEDTVLDAIASKRDGAKTKWVTIK